MGKEILFGLERHSLERFPSYRDMMLSSIQMLTQRYPGKRIVLAMESADTKNYQAEYIEKYINQGGYRPSDTYICGHKGDLSKPPPPYDIAYDKLNEQPDDVNFLGRVLNLLDYLFYEYKGKLYFSIESGTEAEVKGHIEAGDQYEKMRKKEMEFAYRGQFDEATKIFKRRTVIYANSHVKREERFKNKLKQAIARDDVAAAVVSFGAAHTSFVHGFKKDGYDAKPIFSAINDNKTQYFNPGETMLRALILKKGNVADDKWFQYMIGNMLTGIFTTSLKGIKLDNRYNVIAREVNQILLQKLGDVESMRAFESKVRQNGIEAAVKELMPPIWADLTIKVEPVERM